MHSRRATQSSLLQQFCLHINKKNQPQEKSSQKYSNPILREVSHEMISKSSFLNKSIKGKKLKYHAKEIKNPVVHVFTQSGIVAANLNNKKGIASDAQRENQKEEGMQTFMSKKSSMKKDSVFNFVFNQKKENGKYDNFSSFHKRKYHKHIYSERNQRNEKSYETLRQFKKPLNISLNQNVKQNKKRATSAFLTERRVKGKQYGNEAAKNFRKTMQSLRESKKTKQNAYFSFQGAEINGWETGKESFLHTAKNFLKNYTQPKSDDDDENDFQIYM